MHVVSYTVHAALTSQIILNFRRKSSGEFSPITAILAAAGNALRVFTTLVVTHDGLLLAGYLVAALVNGVSEWWSGGRVCFGVCLCRDVCVDFV
jgi:hypothetical protein